jgi:hypothetical protein
LQLGWWPSVPFGSALREVERLRHARLVHHLHGGRDEGRARVGVRRFFAEANESILDP